MQEERTRDCQWRPKVSGRKEQLTIDYRLCCLLLLLLQLPLLMQLEGSSQQLLQSRVSDRVFHINPSSHLLSLAHSFCSSVRVWNCISASFDYITGFPDPEQRCHALPHLIPGDVVCRAPTSRLSVRISCLLACLLACHTGTTSTGNVYPEIHCLSLSVCVAERLCLV